MKRMLSAALCTLLVAVTWMSLGAFIAYHPARAQQGTLQSQYGGRDGYNRPVMAGDFISYSPTQLGVNAIVLPASSSTTISNTIDLRQVRQLKLFFNCTQAVNLAITEFAEDGVTTGFAGAFVTSMGSGSQFFVAGSETNTSLTSSGTVAINLRLPDRAIGLQWTNTTATPGTCTARLFLAY